ncbi:MAG TPA: hypothetical protein VFA20_34165 [Myxococcaceae bacterium]|nr:hypothetical protein [Myxococcaceae bacterium]
MAWLCWVVAGSAAAQAGSTTLTGKVKADAEERARVEVADLLRTLCPEQCVLLGVEARVEEETSADAPPGFEQVTPGAKLPVLRTLSATVLLDEELPSAFRSKARSLVSERLKALGAAPTVNIQTVKFPPRNAPHLDADDKDKKADPFPKPDPSENQPQLSPGEKMQERLAESAPLLVVALLALLAVLGVGALMVLAMRRASQAPAPLPEYEELPEVEQAQGAGAAAPVPVELSPERARRLEKSLREERTVRNALIRDALRKGEAPLVARWAREMGDFLLEDVQSDVVPHEAIQRLSAELTKPPATDAASRAASIQELEGRLMAARLLYASESAEAAFSFLEGVRPERFASACQGLSPAALEMALRFAPAAHRAAAFKRFPASTKQEIALAWVRRPDPSASHAHAVADELKALVADATGHASRVEQMVLEVVDSLPPGEQEKLVRRLEREGDGKVAKALVTEASLRETPVEVLGAAVLQLPPASLLSYLSGAEPDIRDQVLAACPRSLQGELKEELTLGRTTAPEEFLAARRELLARLRDELDRRGARANGNGGRS